MTSASKTPALNGVVPPFLTSVSFPDEDDFYEGKHQLGLHSKAKILNNIAEKSTSSYMRPMPGQEEQVVDNNGHRHIDNGGGDRFARPLLSTVDRESSFSPENNFELGNAFKPANILKEQTNYPPISDGWQNHKRHRVAVEQTLERKDFLRDQTKSLDEGRDQLFHLALSPSDQQTLRRSDGATSQSFHLPLQRASTELSSMHNKAYDVMTPRSHASDVIDASVNMRSASMSQSLHSVKWNERHIEQRSEKFYNGKKYQEQCASGKLSEVKQLSDREISAMNATSLSVAPATATDLSQHAMNNHNAIFQREDSIENKVYPHLFLPAHSIDQRHRELQEQAAKGNREDYIVQQQVDGNKEDKKYHLGSFKQTAWGGFGHPNIFTEHQQQGVHHQQTPFDSGFYPDCNPAGISHLQERHFDGNPILLKEQNMLVKQEGLHGHHGNIPITWDKTTSPFDRMVGSMYKPERTQCYLKPPPVDLDDLSEDERERMRVKRERNRVAAAKCRNRRRELLERLEKEAEQLEREQDVLRENVKKLQAQKRKLGSMLDKHEPGCSNNIEQCPGKSFPEEDATDQNPK